MWVLMFISLILPSQNTVLDRFPNEQLCQRERARVGFEMAESYPNEADFKIVCEFRPHGIQITT